MSASQPLAITEMLAYMTVYPVYDKERFVTYMVALDNAFLKFQYDKQESESKKSKSKSKK